MIRSPSNMKTLLLLAIVVALGMIGGCISVERDTPDTVSVERTTVIRD